MSSRTKSASFTGLHSRFAIPEDNLFLSHLDQAVAVEPVVLDDYDGQFRSKTEINEENSPAAWKISIKAKRRKFFKFPNGLRLLEKKCRDVSLQFLLIEDGENLKFVPASEFFLKSDFVYEPVVEVL